MTNEIRSSNDEAGQSRSATFGFRASSLFRASSFVLRHSTSYQIDLFAFFQGHDGFLPVRPPSQWPPDAFLFAGVIAGVHIDHLLLKQPFNCVLDLDFARARAHAENIFVQLFTHQRRLLSQRCSFNDLVRLVHFYCAVVTRLRDAGGLVLSASCSSALCVTRIFSNASNCSVLTSEAVASRTGFTLRADLKVV